MNRLALVFFGLALAAQVHAQAPRWHFVQYLIAKRQFDEAAYVLRQMVAGAPAARLDSVNLWLARMSYEQQQIPEAIEHYDRVTAQRPTLYREAAYYGAFLSAYQKQFDDALARYTRAPADSSVEGLRRHHLAAVWLLKRDLKKTDSLLAGLPGDHSLLAQRRQLADVPRKSPAVAGILSAVMPGAGRWYAGNRGQALYTFLIAVVAGLQAYEAWERAGPQSARFIAYGALFTSVYIGSIWGSTLSVKVRRDQIHEQINQQVLVDMHIALRSRFR